jgi:hypothetical protein
VLHGFVDVRRPFDRDRYRSLLDRSHDGFLGLSEMKHHIAHAPARAKRRFVPLRVVKRAQDGVESVVLLFEGIERGGGHP